MTSCQVITCFRDEARRGAWFESQHLNVFCRTRGIERSSLSLFLLLRPAGSMAMRGGCERRWGAEKSAHYDYIAQIFPATAWQSVFATNFALLMSNPYTRISNAELPFLTTRPKPARVVLLKYT